MKKMTSILIAVLLMLAVLSCEKTVETEQGKVAVTFTTQEYSKVYGKKNAAIDPMSFPHATIPAATFGLINELGSKVALFIPEGGLAGPDVLLTPGNWGIDPDARHTDIYPPDPYYIDGNGIFFSRRLGYFLGYEMRYDDSVDPILNDGYIIVTEEGPNAFNVDYITNEHFWAIRDLGDLLDTIEFVSSSTHSIDKLSLPIHSDDDGDYHYFYSNVGANGILRLLFKDGSVSIVDLDALQLWGRVYSGPDIGDGFIQRQDFARVYFFELTITHSGTVEVTVPATVGTVTDHGYTYVPIAH